MLENPPHLLRAVIVYQCNNGTPGAIPDDVACVTLVKGSRGWRIGNASLRRYSAQAKCLSIGLCSAAFLNSCVNIFTQTEGALPPGISALGWSRGILHSLKVTE